MPSAAERSENSFIGKRGLQTHEQTQTGGRGQQVSGEVGTKVEGGSGGPGLRRAGSG